MAKTSQQKAISSLIKTAKAQREASSPSFSSGPSLPTGGLSNQIGNLTQRISGSGFDPNKALDTRNPIEKMLNLKQDQNVIFDIFELINRPQQALFGGIESLQKGKDIGRGFMEGLSGKKDTSGGQLFRNMGIGDDKGFGIDDVLGFGADVLLDPADLIGVGVGGDIAKVLGDNAKYISKLDDIASAGKLVTETGDVLSDVSKIADVINAGGKVMDASAGVGDALKAINIAPSVLKTLETGKDSVSLTDAVMRGLGAGAKAGLGLGDNLVSKGLGALDTALGKGDKLGAYTGIKEALEKTFNAGKNIPNAVKDQFRSIMGKSKFADEMAEGVIKRFDDMAKIGQEGYEKLGIDGNFADDISKWQSMVETQKFPVIKGDDLKYMIDNGALPVGLINSVNSTDIVSKLQELVDKGITAGHKVDPDIISKSLQSYTDNAGRQIQALNFNKETMEQFDKLFKDPSLDVFFKEAEFKNPFTYAQDNPAFKEIVERLSKTDVGRARIQAGLSLEDEIKDAVSKVMGNTDSFGDDFYSRRKAKEGYVDKVKGTTADTLTAHKSTGFMTPQDFNQFKRDTFDMVYGGSHGANWNALEKAEFKKVIDSGVLEESLSATIPDFKKKYLGNVKQSQMLDRVLLSPIAGDVGKVNDSWKQLSEIQKQIGKATDPEDALRLTSQLDTLKSQLAGQTKDMLVQPTSLLNKVNGKVDLPVGYIEVDPKVLQSQIDKMSKYTQAKTPELEQLQRALSSGAFKDGMVIDEHFNNMINLMQNKKSQDKVTQNILKVFDGVNNMFKKSKLLSPAYNIRNVMGGVTNMALAGVDPAEIPDLMRKSLDIDKTAKGAIEALQQGLELTAKQEEALTIFNRFREYGFGGDMGSKIMDVDQFLKEPEVSKKLGVLGKSQGAIKAITDANVKANNFVDNLTRMSTMLFFENNPEKLVKTGFQNAGEAVRWAMFDPEDLSKMESNYIKKIIPFYTFTKKNLAYQMSNLTTNPSYYGKLIRGMDSLWESSGINTNDLEEYQRNGSQIPIPFLSGGGDITTLKSNLPFADLFETVSDPMGKIANMLSPVIKAPIEATTGIQTFSGRPIEAYKGEMSTAIPFLSKKQEWGLGQLGLDVPLKTASNAVGMFTNPNKMSATTNLLGMTSTTSMEKIIANKQYQQLQALQDYVKKLTAQGGEIKTLSQIENENKELTAIQARIQSLLK